MEKSSTYEDFLFFIVAKLQLWIRSPGETAIMWASHKYVHKHPHSRHTFFTLSFSWLLEWVSSSMSESPQSECSETLGASGTLAFLVLGGRAGGAGSKPILGSGLCWWATDAAATAAVAAPSGPWWMPLAGGWLILATPLVLESWELRLVCWRSEAEEDEGVAVLWMRRLGLPVPTCSSDDDSKSGSRLCTELSPFKEDLPWYGR